VEENKRNVRHASGWERKKVGSEVRNSGKTCIGKKGVPGKKGHLSRPIPGKAHEEKLINPP